MIKVIFRVLGVLVLAFGVFVLAGIAATWEPDKSVQELSLRWGKSPSQFIPVAGMQVHVRDEGVRDDPNPIVLLHGTSASLHTWDGWVGSLEKQRRVIRFDLPGFGLTGPNPDSDYSIASYVRFVTAVVDTLGIKKFVLAGNSLGGEIAWATAVEHPERVSQLVLVDAAGYALHSVSVPVGFRMARTPGLNTLLRYVLPRGIVESSLRNVYGDPGKVTPVLVDRYYEMALCNGNRQALVERLNQLVYGDTNRLKQLRIPTLILWGMKDRLIPLENGKQFASDIAGSELVVFDGLGHVPQEEDPSATVAVVKKFLSRS